METQSSLWSKFSGEVGEHIENYVIPQYGELEHDVISSYDLKGYKDNLNRYVARIGSGRRGREEALRDCLKIAHYASRLYYDILRNER